MAMTTVREYEFSDVNSEECISVSLAGKECFRLVRDGHWQLYAVANDTLVGDVITSNRYRHDLIERIRLGYYICQRQHTVANELPVAHREHAFFEKAVSPQEMHNYINAVEDNKVQNTSLLLFNDALFIKGSYIVRHQGQWVFRHSRGCYFSDWQWAQDLPEAITRSLRPDDEINAAWQMKDRYHEVNVRRLPRPYTRMERSTAFGR